MADNRIGQRGIRIDDELRAARNRRFAVGRQQADELLTVGGSQGGPLERPLADAIFARTYELAQAEISQPEAACVPIDQWLTDPADDQRYEAGLRSLFGAVEALEDTKAEGW